MKTTISNDKGVVTEKNGDGFYVGSQTHDAAVFNERWDDLYAFIDEGTGPAQLTYEAYRDTGFYMRFYRHNQDDETFVRFQMPHSWDPLTNVRPHMHVIPCASGSGVVKFNYAYTWSLVHGGFSGSAGWISGSVTASYTPANQYNQEIISLGTIPPPAGSEESAMLVFKIERPGASDAADTYTASKPDGTAAANLGILFIDLHHQKIKAGTTVEFPT